MASIQMSDLQLKVKTIETAYTAYVNQMISVGGRNGFEFKQHIAGAGEFAQLLTTDSMILQRGINGSGLGNLNVSGIPVGGSTTGLDPAGLTTLAYPNKTGTSQQTVDTFGTFSTANDVYKIYSFRSKYFFTNVLQKQMSKLENIDTALLQQFIEQAVQPEIDYHIVCRSFTNTAYALDSNGEPIEFSTETIAEWAKCGFVPYPVIDVRKMDQEFQPFEHFQIGYDFMNPTNARCNMSTIGQIRKTATAGNMKNASNILLWDPTLNVKCDVFWALDKIEEFLLTDTDDSFKFDNALTFVAPELYNGMKENKDKFQNYIQVDTGSGKNINRNILSVNGAFRFQRVNQKRTSVYGWNAIDGWNKNIAIKTDSTAITPADYKKENNFNFLLWVAGDPSTIHYVSEQNVKVQLASSSNNVEDRYRDKVVIDLKHDCFIKPTDAGKNFWLIRKQADKVSYGNLGDPITPPVKQPAKK